MTFPNGEPSQCAVALTGVNCADELSAYGQSAIGSRGTLARPKARSYRRLLHRDDEQI